MEIELRIPDDYCQGDVLTSYPAYEDDYEEDLGGIRSRGFKMTPRNRLTSKS